MSEYIKIEDLIAIAKDDLLQFEGWTDGYVHGAKLSEEPRLFLAIKGHVYDYISKLQEEMSSGLEERKRE